MFDPDKKPKFKVVFEYILAISVSMAIVALLIFGGMSIYLREKFPPSDENILGADVTNTIEDENSSDVSLPKSIKKNPEGEIQISSGLQKDIFVFFDNENRKYLEGIATPNSYVEMRMKDKRAITKSNPNGFFSFEIQSDTVQFTPIQILDYQSNFQVGSSLRFVIVLRKYLDRTYFFLPEKNEVFSIQLGNIFTTTRDDFTSVHTANCVEKVDEKVSATNFSFVKDKDLVIFPYSIQVIDFEKNPFVAFRVSAEPTGNYTLSECIDQWRTFEPTFAWHTKIANEIFRKDIENSFSNPVSSTV